MLTGALGLYLVVFLLIGWLIVRLYNRKHPGADLSQGAVQPKEHLRSDLAMGPITERNGHKVVLFRPDGGEADPTWVQSHQADRKGSGSWF